MKSNKDSENGAEPSAPISKKGILTSFLSGKSMDIPDSDIVAIKFTLLYFYDNCLPISVGKVQICFRI